MQAPTNATIKRLKSVNWYFFDLDDTLHEFRKASSAAVDATLRLIIEQHAPHEPSSDELLTVARLKAKYTEILKTSTSAAFVDGKTSHEYRAQRFQSVMDAFSIEYTEQQMERLLEAYENVTTQNLQLKQGAIALLETLKQQGKSIAIITEGPQDSQERTVAALGLQPYYDRLVTTNKLGVAKIDGLFGKALDMIGVQSDEVVMVGDSWNRDIVPAMEAGTRCVWLAEKEEESKRFVMVGREEKGTVTVVNSLGRLQSVVL
jgi:putative hydrolase of the HAD superfamily